MPEIRILSILLTLFVKNVHTSKISFVITFIYLQWYYFLSLNRANILESFPNETRSTNSSAVGQITCSVIITSNEVKCQLLQEFKFITFSENFN